MDIKNSQHLRDNLKSLIEPEQMHQPLPALPRRGTVPSIRGRADWVSRGGDGGGVESPLTEVPKTRVYGSEVCVVPPSGYFAYCARPVIQMTFKDGAGAEIVVNLEENNYQSEGGEGGA